VDKDAHELAPDAWLINYINPTACLGILLMRHGKCRSFALCDGNHEPYRRRGLLRTVGLLNGKPDPELEARADIRICGVNHFTWLTRFEVAGIDYMPKYREHLAQHAADQDENPYSKGRKNGRYQLALYDVFGAVPTATGHTKEYVPYWQGYTKNAPDIEPITLFDADERARKREGIYKEIDEYNSRQKPMAEFFEKVNTDHATDIIESMWGGLGKPFFINQPNRGAVSNLPDDAFLELRSDVDMDGPRPQPVGELPRGVRGLTEQVLDTHELTAEAAVTCDRKVLRRAMLTDPIVNSISDADAIIEDMLEAQRASLPTAWFRA
jgi:alpha-galactosidase